MWITVSKHMSRLTHVMSRHTWSFISNRVLWLDLSTFYLRIKMTRSRWIRSCTYRTFDSNYSTISISLANGSAFTLQINTRLCCRWNTCIWQLCIDIIHCCILIRCTEMVCYTSTKIGRVSSALYTLWSRNETVIKSLS